MIGIAVEGPSPEDQKDAAAATVEIADLVLYYGKWATFSKARAVVIVQFKYSIGSKIEPFRASDARKTVRKFAAAFRSHKRKHGAKIVREKLQFELITNRPVFPAFDEGIAGIAAAAPLQGDAKRQAAQFKSACGLKAAELAEFAGKCRITGLAGSVRKNKQDLSRILADWSPAPDAMARARLGNLRQMLRDKAGSEGEGKNVVRRVDVLDALEVQTPDDLFPCPASFPEVGKVVERAQLSAVVELIPKLEKPLLIHAAGGLGKTVFLQSLAKKLSDSHETILFDCFGGGAYRSPKDARHLPKYGLVHIINSLAVDGLCDPLLPASENVEDLIKAFHARLGQAVVTLRRGSRDKQLLLFIDAVDNAAEHARDKGERAFPTLLLESFHHSGPVRGVQLIVSCRTHRRDISRGHVPCEEFELKPFTEREAQHYLRDRLAKATDTETKVAYARSSGNPRILEHLVRDRGLLDASELKNKIELDDLLRARINDALAEALKQGYKGSAIKAFLAGLSVLPPPVPPAEYANAHGMDLSAVESFAADLAPLLERTKHGLMFRDEPTETLVRENYAAEPETLRLLADNLFRMQDASVYAASALPGLLQKLDDGKRLFQLAFDERFPNAITSTVGKQNIRYARLKAAVLHASRKENFNQLVHLLVELSTHAAINERGRDYLLDNPDLVIASQDVDATRRLFETRTNWPGTRYARLAIASILVGDVNDAFRHAISAHEWLFHYYGQKNDDRKAGPEKLDVASIPLCLIAQNRGHDAAQFLKRYNHAWYVYEVCEHVFALLVQAQATQAIKPEQAARFLNALKPHIGLLAAALSFSEQDDVRRRQFIGDLAKACAKNKKPIETDRDFHRERDYILQDGLWKAAAIAVSLGLHTEAETVAAAAPHERPRLWSLTDRFSNHNVFPFLVHTALLAAVQRRAIDEQALLPSELVEIGGRVKGGLTGDPFRKAFKTALEEQFKAEQGTPDDKRVLSYDTKRDAERFVDERLEGLLELIKEFSALLSSASGKADKPFLDLLQAWVKLRKKRSNYSDVNETNLFFDLVGLEFLSFSLWSRSDLGTAAVKEFVGKITEDGITHARTLVEIATLLSKRASLHELAGEAAVKARTLIEREDEVDYRANLFARLSKAILPASSAEAATYFRAGLEQMDAIGSGDYQFTNELLLLASELPGGEMEEQDFHTLSNICELNMSEAEKFPWGAFGRGMSRVSGNRMLAKLGRWHDRSKISLDYTLLPYLAALMEQDKIDPRTALALLRLADSQELRERGQRSWRSSSKASGIPTRNCSSPN
ncbi:MAG: NACHT domain-containing protein [Gammaproteobacteria bacterium]